jgi:WD domain, G-beta repeat
MKLALRILGFTAVVLALVTAGVGSILVARAPQAEKPEIFPQLGHTASVYSVAWRPDGKTLASGSGDQTVKLWDSGTGQLLRTLSGHTAYVYSVAWSPDGKTLASGSGDQTVKLWDSGTGQLLRTLSGHTASLFGGVEAGWQNAGQRQWGWGWRSDILFDRQRRKHTRVLPISG